MAGIIAFGAYVPRYRLDRKLIFKAMGWFNPATFGAARGEKAVANHDEDSITMAVAAARDLLAGRDTQEIDALYLASTTLPYAERQNAAIVAAALDLQPGDRSMDIGGSLRAGTSALLTALDAVRAGDCSKALVCAADGRLGKLGGKSEHVFGDGAASFLMGTDGVIAEFLGGASMSADLADHRRSSSDRFDRSWEERWIRDEGYIKLIEAAATACLDRCGLDPPDIDRVVVACPDHRALGVFARRWGLPRERFQDNLVAGVGDTGAALAPMMLAAALEQASPGEKVLVLGYGSGADALLFETTDAISLAPRGLGISGHLACKAELGSYEKFAVFRRLLPLDLGIRGESMAPTAFSVLWRDRSTVLSLHGNRCTRCGTPHFPPNRICIHPECGAVDEMEEYPFASREGRLFTYTADMLAFSFDPPQLYGLVDFEGGGRLFLDLTDCSRDELKVGMPVSLSFRRKYLDEQGGVHGYFWKARPRPS